MIVALCRHLGLFRDPRSISRGSKNIISKPDFQSVTMYSADFPPKIGCLVFNPGLNQIFVKIPLSSAKSVVAQIKLAHK